MKRKAKVKQRNPRPKAKAQADNPNSTVCFCLQVNRSTIANAIEHGATSLEAIGESTGAGSQCGSCRLYIKELLGENLWRPVSLASSHRYSDNYCALRFSPVDGDRWDSQQPGAYFILQAQIDGQWIGRPYAITEDGADSGHREITVKRKKDGYFSNWLFDHLQQLPDIPLRISSCMGGAAFEANPAEPIICLIGGVGITPVLALCRKLAKQQPTAEICIDYSASSEEDFFCRSELMQLAQSCNLHAIFRSTQRQGHIQQADVDALIDRYPAKRFYICGPESFKSSVSKLLRESHGAPKEIIDLESSDNKNPEPPQTSTDLHWGYRILGLSLLLAYYLQDRLDIKLTELERLQANDDYKIFSGLLLLTYVLSQWRLPITRWLNRNADKLLRKKRSHQSFGTIAPLVFYLHATSIGYAYLAALASVYLANSLLGYGSGEFIGQRFKKAYVFGWTLMHVGLSTCLLFLSAYHAYIALAYK